MGEDRCSAKHDIVRRDTDGALDIETNGDAAVPAIGSAGVASVNTEDKTLTQSGCAESGIAVDIAPGAVFSRLVEDADILALHGIFDVDATMSVIGKLRQWNCAERSEILLGAHDIVRSIVASINSLVADRRTVEEGVRATLVRVSNVGEKDGSIVGSPLGLAVAVLAVFHVCDVDRAVPIGISSDIGIDLAGCRCIGWC